MTTEKELDASEHAAIAKKHLKEAYKSLLKSAEIEGSYEYKDSIKIDLLNKASRVIDISSSL